MKTVEKIIRAHLGTPTPGGYYVIQREVVKLLIKDIEAYITYINSTTTPWWAEEDEEEKT